jgi:predicted DNA-binding protein (MmcQ/YjbR family)
MNIDTVHEHCLSLPYVTENLQWGEHLCFKVGGKMFCILALEPQELVVSFKASAENFIALQEVVGIVPAPYMARAQWLGLEGFQVLRDDELRELLTEAHRIIFEKLPKKVRAELGGAKAPKRRVKQLRKPQITK